MKSNGNVIDRRDFLVVSSTCALAATLAPNTFGDVLPPSKRLAIGFAPLEENTSSMAAAEAPSGDGGFISRGALIRISGVSGAAADPRLRRVVGLVAHFPYRENGQEIDAPFYAWASGRNGGWQSYPLSFNFPVDERQQLRFSVLLGSGSSNAGASMSRRRAVGAVRTDTAALPLTLSLLSGSGLSSLARGHYIIVPRVDGEPEPRWSDWRLGRVGGRSSLVSIDGTPAPFEHFVLRVDYATVQE